VTDRHFRILVLGDSRSFHIERYITQLKALDCQVMLASLEDGSTHHFHLKRWGPLPALHYSLSVAQIRGIVERFRPDIVNPHFASGYGASTTMAIRRDSVPIVLHLWGSDILIVPNKSPLHRRKTRLALRAAAHIFADSKYLMDEAAKLSPLREGTVFPWGIERDLLKYHRQDYTLGKPLRILVPRMHEPVYNNMFLVRALADLVRKERIQLTFPRFGSLTGNFEQESAVLVGDRLQLYDVLRREDFIKLMAQHDICLSAARSDSSPVSVIEAMALGVIPIAADIPGVREWLTDQSGYLYPEDDSDALRAIIESLLDSQDDHTTMRKTNLEKVKSEAIFEQNISRQLAIMEDLAATWSRS
jgi:glycosyltransferase involved in cell wall biosynthesis